MHQEYKPLTLSLLQSLQPIRYEAQILALRGERVKVRADGYDKS